MAAANDPNKKKIKTATKNTKHKSRKFTYFCDPRGKNTKLELTQLVFWSWQYHFLLFL